MHELFILHLLVFVNDNHENDNKKRLR